MLVIQILILIILILLSFAAFVITFYLFWMLEKHYSKRKLVQVKKPNLKENLNDNLDQSQALNLASTDRTDSLSNSSSKLHEENEDLDKKLNKNASIKNFEPKFFSDIKKSTIQSDKLSSDIWLKSNPKSPFGPYDKIKDSILSIKKDYTQPAKLPDSLLNKRKNSIGSGKNF